MTWVVAIFALCAPIVLALLHGSAVLRVHEQEEEKHGWPKARR